MENETFGISNEVDSFKQDYLNRMNNIIKEKSNETLLEHQQRCFIFIQKFMSGLNEEFKFMSNSNLFTVDKSKLKYLIKNIEERLDTGLKNDGLSMDVFIEQFFELYNSDRKTISYDVMPMNFIEKLIRMVIFAYQYRKLLKTMDLDVNNDKNLKETPYRVSKMYFNELFTGLYEEVPAITVFENDNKIDEMIFTGPIQVYGACSHHFVMIDGQVFVGYIPSENLIGLSKISRLAKHIMARPIIQEDAVKLLSNKLQDMLKTEDVAVHMIGKHYCTRARGVKDTSNYMVTNAMGGLFLENDNSIKTEFFKMVENAKTTNWD
jgi:GTP cyclohydrolase IA